MERFDAREAAAVECRGGVREATGPSVESMTVTPAAAALLLVAGVSLTVTDLRSGRIPNAVTLPMMVIGLVLHALPAGWGLGSGDPMVAVVGWAVGLGILIIPFALNLIKAGDVKYLAAIGAVGGAPVALFAFLYGSLAHGLLCWLVLRRRGEVDAAFENIGFWLRNSLLARRAVDFTARSQGTVPYALGLALGCVAVLVSLSACGSVFWLWT